MSKNVAILTEFEEDPHAIVVRKKLEKIGQKVTVIDSGTLPSAALVAYSFLLSERELRITIANEEIGLGDVNSFWYRRPSELRLSKFTHPDYNQVARDEWRTLLDSMWISTSRRSLWVNLPANNRRAELKPLQLDIAQELGLTIPPTIITNDPARASRFCQEHEAVVAKTLYSDSVSHGSRTAAFTTHLLPDLKDQELQGLQQIPCIFQENIPKKIDLRVTVIGERVFSAGIESQADPRTRIDWRASQEARARLRYNVHQLPDEVEKKCQELVRRLGLHFGAIDMVLTTSDDYVFLEVNPNGQWLWVELRTGLPLSDAMAELLASSDSIR